MAGPLVVGELEAVGISLGKQLESQLGSRASLVLEAPSPPSVCRLERKRKRKTRRSGRLGRMLEMFLESSHCLHSGDDGERQTWSARLTGSLIARSGQPKLSENENEDFSFRS